jgi:hypothetical protein
MNKITMSLDLVLAALRNTFHTCYYCAVTTDHQEELQRKCIQHLRKPISKATYDEYKAKMAENSVKIKKEDTDMQEEGDLKSKEKEHSPEDRGRDTATKEDDSREWKKSGTFPSFLIVAILRPRAEDRWIESLDSKIALLLDRDSVDPLAYGGKSYDE